MKKKFPFLWSGRTHVPNVSLQKLLFGKFGLALFLALFCFSALARTGVQNVFAGRENILLRSTEHVAEGDKLTFRVIKDHRTLAAGPVLAKEDGWVELPVALPGMKPGVAMQFELALSRSSDIASVPMVSGKVWALAEQPFVADENPVTMKHVFLYDPDNKTAEALESIKLRVERVDDFNALESVTNAWVVFHEGFSLESVRGFDEILKGLVRHGNNVLLIAPSDGAVPLWEGLEECWYGTAGGLHHQTHIKGMDYELDLSSMPGSRFRLIGVNDDAVLQVDAGRGHEAVIWSDFKNDGKVVFCGLNLISNWDATAAARWLLAEILLFK